MFNRLVTAFHVICIHTHTYTHTNARTHERTVFHSLKQTHLQIGSRECLIAYDTFATSATEISYIGKHTLAILICQTCRLRTQGWPICKNLIEKSCLSKYSTLYFCIWFFFISSIRSRFTRVNTQRCANNSAQQKIWAFRWLESVECDAR